MARLTNQMPMPNSSKGTLSVSNISAIVSLPILIVFFRTGRDVLKNSLPVNLALFCQKNPIHVKMNDIIGTEE
jgi:hypothetical protein